MRHINGVLKLRDLLLRTETTIPSPTINHQKKNKKN